ncbi:MAG TPA: chemotaxis protein CheW [Gammaproteobacteria bacterium]|nr:chemotaxis protein CheW [Gammaproteobacteria bacterium]
MNAVVESVRSLWVPLQGTNLLVPNVAIAEVINYQPLETVVDGPEWLLGALRWRDQRLPVVSMEVLCGQPRPPAERGCRISVVNSVRKDAGLPFYAMVTADIPRLFSADAEALGESLRGGGDFPDTVADVVRIGSEQALIPNLELIQALVEQAWGEPSA